MFVYDSDLSYFSDKVLTIVNKLLPQGFDVSDTAPNTFKELKRVYEQTGRVVVWSGASENTIYRDARVNHAFRAWHDHHHLTGDLPFTVNGEKAVCELQKADCEGCILCEKLLDAEINGQIAFYMKYGKSVLKQRDFVLDFIKNKEKTMLNGENYRFC